ncbi:MAG: 1-deoxy-D-xylulose-5-phosphate reductoisomerase [Cytophagales bacterium]|nr:1-deoxy-D-xylulose-5-phosphate reductoisomerase [Cytophagales bacterium]
MLTEEKKKRGIAILGSTGSIGTQALQVINAHKDLFTVEVLSAHSNADLLIAQSIEYEANVAVIGDQNLYTKVADALQPHGTKVYAGTQSLCSVVEMGTIDMVLTAMVGFSGLLPTYHAIQAGKTIALANKETLVVAGDIITQAARKKGVNILPVDSEHSAIFQCLLGEWHNKIEKIMLTASGGPFRAKTTADLANVTKNEALKHPNWTMGAKITIDSATLMNKGLEVIEAKWLFHLKPEQIEVIVHPQSIIHSMVQFADGSIKAQMGLPDMRLPIQFALAYPQRLFSDFERFDFMKFPSLTFEQPDLQTFRNLALAYHALQKGGNACCVLNAANEVAVDAFLKDKIKFLDISKIIEMCLEKIDFMATPTLEAYLDTDRHTRSYAAELVGE